EGGRPRIGGFAALGVVGASVGLPAGDDAFVDLVLLRDAIAIGEAVLDELPHVRPECGLLRRVAPVHERASLCSCMPRSGLIARVPSRCVRLRPGDGCRHTGSRRRPRTILTLPPPVNRFAQASRAAYSSSFDSGPSPSTWPSE